MNIVSYSGISFVNLRTAERDSLVLPKQGTTIYNLDTQRLEVNVGTAVSPVWVRAGGTEVQATETIKGIAEIATQAETDAGTDDERIVTPLKLKNYNFVASPAPFVEELTSITGSNAGAWITRSLGAGYANKILAIIIESSNSAVKTAGVREVGSAFNLSFSMRSGHTWRETKANASGEIQIFSTSNALSFSIVGTK